MKIFLDLDGPILDNRRKYHAIYTDLLASTAAELLGVDQYWDMKRNRVSEADILSASQVPTSMWQDYLQARIAQIEDFRWLMHDQVWTGVRAWLTATAEDHDLYLVTLRRNRLTLRQQLEYFGLAQFFTDVLSLEGNDGSAQVKVDLLDQILSPGECGMMVGDTELDIEAAQTCGLTAVAVTCGIRSARLLRQVGPNQMVDFLTEIPTSQLALLDFVERSVCETSQPTSRS